MIVQKKQRIISQRFGAALKKCRLERGLTLKDLSDATGISQAYISKLETGERRCPSIVIMRDFSDALGIGLDKLVSIASGKECKFDNIQDNLTSNILIEGNSINPDTKINVLKIIDFIGSNDTDFDKVDDVAKLINYIISLRKSI